MPIVTPVWAEATHVLREDHGRGAAPRHAADTQAPLF